MHVEGEREKLREGERERGALECRAFFFLSLIVLSNFNHQDNLLAFSCRLTESLTVVTISR